MKQYQLHEKKGAKMREGLENRRGGNSTVGSNPTPSANLCCNTLKYIIIFLKHEIGPTLGPIPGLRFGEIA